MRISDWSSDVCSSDLPDAARATAHRRWNIRAARGRGRSPSGDADKAKNPPPARRDRRCRPAARHSAGRTAPNGDRSEEHTSELQSLMRISYAVFCLKKKTPHTDKQSKNSTNTQRTRKIK